MGRNNADAGTSATVSDLIAAIDIGTNSFHLVVARLAADSGFEVVTTQKEVVRLGSGSGDMKELAPDAIDRGIAALTRMREVAESMGAQVHAVATSAVREAENRSEFLDRAEREAGVHVEVISGFEEARLIHDHDEDPATPDIDEPIFVPSGKVDVIVRFDVSPAEEREIVIDFDAGASVQVNETPGSHPYILRPVLTPVRVSAR